MNTGKIILQRQKENFQAGFCIAKEPLDILIKNAFLLHPIEKTYYDQLKVDKRKYSYLLGRLVAKNAIAELIEKESMKDIFINYGIFHFPVVKNITAQNIQVSITHCDDIGIAIAFPEEHPLGIDIEKVNENRIDALKTQINDHELTFISTYNLSLVLGCTMVWCIKEALSKILRTGLTMNLKLVDVECIEKKDSLYIHTFRGFSQYKAVSFHTDNYVCSIVLPKNTTTDLTYFSNSFSNIIVNSN